MSIHSIFKDIADAIRECTGTIETMKPREFADGVRGAYSCGDEKGHEEGFVAGLEEGENNGRYNAYHEFWDTYQQMGNRRHYSYAFAGYGWTDETFKPKYDIIIGNSTSTAMFSYNKVTNLKKILDEQNVELITGDCTDLGSMFSGCSNLWNIPPIDASSSKHCNQMFSYCGKINGIELTLKDDGSQTFTNTFLNCNELYSLKITGVIGESISLKQSKYLSKASVLSVLNALSKTATGKTLTLSSALSYLASYTDVKKAMDEKQNWTINFA